jgi:prepilin peptidase CpaA
MKSTVLLNSILIVLIIIVCYSDIRWNRIHNIVTIPALLTGVLLNLLFTGSAGLKLSLIGMTIGFCILLLLFLAGGIGGGDIKLLAAIGAIKGYPFILWATFYGVLVGGIIALFVMARYGVMWQSIKNICYRGWCLVVPGLKYVPLDKSASLKIPYGVAIGIGTIWALLVV